MTTGLKDVMRVQGYWTDWCEKTTYHQCWSRATRPLQTQEEREKLALFLAFRGRAEIEGFAGSAGYVISQTPFKFFKEGWDGQWIHYVLEHSFEEGNHGLWYCRAAAHINPQVDPFKWHPKCIALGLEGEGKSNGWRKRPYLEEEPFWGYVLTSLILQEAYPLVTARPLHTYSYKIPDEAIRAAGEKLRFDHQFFDEIDEAVITARLIRTTVDNLPAKEKARVRDLMMEWEPKALRENVPLWLDERLCKDIIVQEVGGTYEHLKYTKARRKDVWEAFFGWPAPELPKGLWWAEEFDLYTKDPDPDDAIRGLPPVRGEKSPVGMVGMKRE